MKLIHTLKISLIAPSLAIVITLTMSRGIVERIYLDSPAKWYKEESWRITRYTGGEKYMNQNHNVSNQSTGHYRAMN